MRNTLFLSLLAIVFLSMPRTAAAADCSSFGGRATVVQANGLGIPQTILTDTGNIDSTGGAKLASLLNASVPGLVSGEDLHATAIGGGAASRSEASVANLVLNVAGITIGADFVMARANGICGSLGPTLTGITEIDGLTVNGLSIPVTGLPNQSIPLLGGGLMILNEQTSSVVGGIGSLTVSAIHVTVPGITNTIIATPFLVIGPPPDPVIGPPPPGGCEFITGGGFITGTPTLAKGTFGVSGGDRNGVTFGHLEYHDHGLGINVHGTGVFSYGPTTVGTGREIQGTAEVNGVPGYIYTVVASDNGEPGLFDTFSITLAGPGLPFAGYAATGAMNGTLGGGNIQLHTKCCGGN